MKSLKQETSLLCGEVVHTFSEIISLNGAIYYMHGDLVTTMSALVFQSITTYSLLCSGLIKSPIKSKNY